MDIIHKPSNFLIVHRQLRGKKFFRSKVAKTESQASASDSYPVEDGYDSFDQDEISVVDEKVTPAGGSHELEEFKIYLNSSSDGNLVEQVCLMKRQLSNF